ncbi:MAG: TIR domain-containing protein [Albidovulum sp.]|nr:TIR domain-containing protein [Albidovulum sp.]
MTTQKNIFISHHYGDDSHVDSFTQMLGRSDNVVRNSSVRMKPANERPVQQGRVKDATIKRLLRKKIRWASTVVALIGPMTHTRPWVNWESEQPIFWGNASLVSTCVTGRKRTCRRH